MTQKSQTGDVTPDKIDEDCYILACLLNELEKYAHNTTTYQSDVEKKMCQIIRTSSGPKDVTEEIATEQLQKSGESCPIMGPWFSLYKTKKQCVVSSGFTRISSKIGWNPIGAEKLDEIGAALDGVKYEPLIQKNEAAVSSAPAAAAAKKPFSVSSVKKSKKSKSAQDKAGDASVGRVAKGISKSTPSETVTSYVNGMNEYVRNSNTTSVGPRRRIFGQIYGKKLEWLRATCAPAYSSVGAARKQVRIQKL